MPKSTFIGTPQSRVATEPVRPGSLIFTDEHRLYWDSPDAKRYEIADILELESEVARQAITKPLNKFYYVLSTNTLYRYNHGWKDLSSGSGGGGGGTGPVEPFELTLDKLIPFASDDEPVPITNVGRPGTAGEYARADHSHRFDLGSLNFDCGYFPGITPPTEVAIHNISSLAHPLLIVDGNISSPPRTDYPDLAAHIADVYAHCDMVFDGNDDSGDLSDESLPAHSLNRHAHRNLRLDGGNLLAN